MEHELVKSSSWPEQRQRADPTVTSRLKLARCGDLEVLILDRNEFHQLINEGKAAFLLSGYRDRRIMSLSSPPPGPNSANALIQQPSAD